MEIKRRDRRALRIKLYRRGNKFLQLCIVVRRGAFFLKTFFKRMLAGPSDYCLKSALWPQRFYTCYKSQQAVKTRRLIRLGIRQTSSIRAETHQRKEKKSKQPGASNLLHGPRSPYDARGAAAKVCRILAAANKSRHLTPRAFIFPPRRRRPPSTANGPPLREKSPALQLFRHSPFWEQQAQERRTRFASCGV